MAKRTYSDEDRAAVYVSLTINRGNISRTARDTGVPEQTIRQWRDRWESDGPPEEVVDLSAPKAQDFIIRISAVRDLMVEELEKQIRAGLAKPRDLITGIGVTTDKINLAHGLATSRSETVHSLPTREEIAELMAGFVAGALEAADRRQADIELVVSETSEEVPALPSGD